MDFGFGAVDVVEETNRRFRGARRERGREGTTRMERYSLRRALFILQCVDKCVLRTRYELVRGLCPWSGERVRRNAIFER